MFRTYVALFFAFALIVAHPSLKGRSAEESSQWLRGRGSNLELRLHGEVLDATGNVAHDAIVTATAVSEYGDLPLEVKVTKNQFEVWVPVNKHDLYYVSLTASSNNKEQVVAKSIAAFEMRQAAVDGVKLLLQIPTQQIEVNVTDQGQGVANAWLRTEVDYALEEIHKTDDNGVVRLKILPHQKLTRLTAWTDDFRIGGHSFDRMPLRIPEAPTQSVELSRCRDLKMRFVDESGNAVSNLEFDLHVATPAPNFNYVGMAADTLLKTDDHGEATYRWFPDWKEHHLYAESKSDSWYVDKEYESVGDTITFKLTRSKKAYRKRVTGFVRWDKPFVGGFCVSVQSFQGDREGFSDAIKTFTNADGSFSADVLPDATYCVNTIDTNWVSDIIDLIPYQSATKEITPIELVMSQGQPVELQVVTGRDKKPFPNVNVQLETEHTYSWKDENGKQWGTGSRRWSATTDQFGMIKTVASPGKLNVSVYTPQWTKREAHDVSMGLPTRITLHREIEAPTKVSVQLRIDDGVQAELSHSEVTIGALGGDSREGRSFKSSADGSFSFETSSSPVGVFAYTSDGKASGMIELRELERSVVLSLRPTMSYHGQLVDQQGIPIQGASVTATVVARGALKRTENSFAEPSFVAKSLSAITDRDGKYTIDGLPVGMLIRLKAAYGKDNTSESLGNVFLEDNERRPVHVSKIGPTSETASKTLAERLEKSLRYSRMLGYRVVVILSDNSDTSNMFVNANFMDYDSNVKVASFLQILVNANKTSMKESTREFIVNRKWKLPDDVHVRAYVLDANGVDLGNLDVDIASSDSPAKVASFINAHCPQKSDAEKKWNEAFAEAKRSNRKVWARIGQRYCGPCFSLADWIEDHREQIEKDYVLLKIDDFSDENGAEVAKRITLGGRFGIPFYAIFDADEKLLINSVGPLGNIGYPSGYEGSKHLRKMLEATRNQLTVEEVEQLTATLLEE